MRKSLIAVALLGVFSQISYAQAITVSQNELYEDDIVAQDATISLTNDGTIENEQIILKGGTFINRGTIHTGTLDILTTNSGESPLFQGEITADEEIIYREDGAVFSYGIQLDSIVHTPTLKIIGNSAQPLGLSITSQETIEDVGELWVESLGQKTGVIIESKGIRLPDTVYLVHNSDANDARVEVMAGASVELNNVYASGNKTMIQVNGNASASVKNIVIDPNSVMNLQTINQIAK